MHALRQLFSWLNHLPKGQDVRGGSISAAVVPRPVRMRGPLGLGRAVVVKVAAKTVSSGSGAITMALRNPRAKSHGSAFLRPMQGRGLVESASESTCMNTSVL